MIEAALRGVLIGYWDARPGRGGRDAAHGCAWRRGRGGGTEGGPAAGCSAGLAVCLACLVSLVVLELGSAAWRGWMHRLPALPTTFEPSPPDEYRIVVLGGSSALGEPYRPWLSVGQIVAWQLQQAVPDRRFECEILAWLGDSLEKQHRKLAGIRRRPDAVIIYSGHNEFVARFENGREERDPGIDEEPRSWLLRQAYRATLLSPSCRLAYEIISKNRLDEPPLMAGRHQLIDPPLCSPSEAADILADFRRRLEAIVGLLRADRRPADPDHPAGQRVGLRAQPVHAPALGLAGRPAMGGRHVPRRPRRRSRPTRTGPPPDTPRSSTGSRTSPRPISAWRGCSNAQGKPDRGRPALPRRPGPRRPAHPLPGPVPRRLSMRSPVGIPAASSSTAGASWPRSARTA